MAEFTADPTGRKILVTDATTPVGASVVRAMCAAGAEIVWAGRAEPWGVIPHFDDAVALPQAEVVPLDVTDGDSVISLAGRIGGRTDIVINTSEYMRPPAVLAGAGVETARIQMEVAFLGLMRLAQAFGPALAARAQEGKAHALGWVNILSINALASAPGLSSISAVHAAAHSYAEAMRAQFRKSGLKVVNLFPGPIDDDWSRQTIPPKVSPAALAGAVVDALRSGVEDVFPDPVARDWYARWREDPAAFARDIAAASA
ncbi:MAG: SDR family NAD(P)-dependent oxidoreductase [Pseudomonadota bacterium]